MTRTETTNTQGNVTGVTYSEPTEADRQAIEQQRQAEIDKAKAEAVERAKQLEDIRIGRNKNLQSMWDSGRIREGDDSWSTKPGTGYHFLKNVRMDDGNFYAEFKSNRGSNSKWYSISERKWMDDWPTNIRCSNCREFMQGFLYRYEKTCPRCGTVKKQGEY